MKLRTLVRIIFAVVVVLVVIWLNKETTPPQCRVPVSQMSQACLDLVAPN